LENNETSLRYTGGQLPLNGRRAGTSGFILGGANAPKSAASPPPNQPATVSSVDAVIGAQAVQMSKTQREQQERLSLYKEDNVRKDAVQRVADKTFYLIDGVWTDSEFKAESHLPETTLVFGSDAYFALLKQNPKLGSYFSLGERVVVVFEGRVYRVTNQ
jgi:hypothetical protein